jgi:hypothetical protein
VLSPALPALKSAFGGGAGAQTWARWALTTPALFVAVGAPLGGLLLAGGGMGLLVPSLTDGVGEAVPEAVRGRALGGLSTLRNLGRFAAPVLTTPALVGPGASAPFVGGTMLAGGLALLLLGGVGACHLPRRASAAHDSEPQPSLCNA